jgi:hypothetical protein
LFLFYFLSYFLEILVWHLQYMLEDTRARLYQSNNIPQHYVKLVSN